LLTTNESVILCCIWNYRTNHILIRFVGPLLNTIVFSQVLRILYLIRQFPKVINYNGLSHLTNYVEWLL